MHVPEEETSAEEGLVLEVEEDIVLEERGELVLEMELWRDDIDDE